MSGAYVDLYDILPDIDVDYEHWAKCERDVITPALREAGYQLRGHWYTGDGDSFGPLSRCIQTDRVIVVYG